MRSALVFLTLGTWDAVIQISCSLAQFQMSFFCLLQEAEMVPPFLLLDVCNRAVVLSSFNNTCSLVLFKGIYVEFIFHTIPSSSNFCHLICASPAFQTCIRKNCKIKRWKFDAGAKASKMFPIHHCT